jgi:hypothetical protein
MLVGFPTVQAADTTLMLACNRTATDISMPRGSTDITIPAGKPEPTSMGIIINFSAGTIAGLDFPIKIHPTKPWSSSRGPTTLNEPSGGFPAGSTA